MIAVLFALLLAPADPRLPPSDLDGAGMRPMRISLTSAAPSQVSPSDPIAPTWTRLPDVEDMMKAFPAEALRNGKGGGAVVACRLTAEGRASDCAVVEETPVGLGFGEAVLALAPKFEFETRGPDGQSLVGGTFRIPLAWNAPR